MKSNKSFLNYFENLRNRDSYTPEMVNAAKDAWDTAMGQVLEELVSVITYYDEDGEYTKVN